MGFALWLGAGDLAKWLNLPADLLAWAGLSLLPFGAVVAWVALRENLSRAGVWLVIVLNVLWVVDSVLLLASGWVAPAKLGYAFLLAQAAVVAVFAELEYAGLRRLQYAA
jgi:hypothetical protein